MAEITPDTLRHSAIFQSPEADQVERFAATELQRYLHRLIGVEPPLRASAAVSKAALAISSPSRAPTAMPTRPEPADYWTSVAPTGVSLNAVCGRSLLDAVYALLGQLGCVWSLHGAENESVPPIQTATCELAPLTHSSPFRVRGYCADIMTWHYTQPEYFHERLVDDRRFIDWMGKSGANAFFFIRHPFDTQLTIPELLPDFAQRGIDVEYGGHVIPLLLPRELYRSHPDYFPTTPGGERTDNGNLCPSSPEALATVARHAVRHAVEHPEMQALHIWGADLWKGGWCRCTPCQAITPQDQGLRVGNAAARALAAAGHRQQVCYLAYHDTIEADLSETPAAGVVCEFAPRERCYAHPINDPTCETNRRYATALERYVAHFAGRVRLFEYYGDAILFFGCAIPLTEVIAADMAYYRNLGIKDVLMLQFGQYSVWAYPLNFLAFAAASAGGAQRHPRRDYCARFGSEHVEAQQVFGELERAMRQIVTYGDVRLKPRPAAAAKQLQHALTAALPQIGSLAERFGQCQHPELRAQATLLRYTQRVFAGIEHEIRTGAAADAIYAEALRLTETVDRRLKGLWGELDLSIIHNFYAGAAFVELG